MHDELGSEIQFLSRMQLDNLSLIRFYNFMAEFIPPLSKDFHGSIGEKIVYEAFQSLPDSVLIFHSFAWTEKENNSFQKQGETDFLIYDPDRGILVIEVKSGGISVENDEWFQTGKNGHRRRMYKNPYLQVEDSKYYILKHVLERKLPNGEKCPINSCLFFPQVEFQRVNLPQYLKREFILDNSNLPNISKGIDRVFQFYNSEAQLNLSAASKKKIKQLLNPFFNLVTVQKWDIEVREEIFIRLTREQTLLLDFLEEQDSAIIGGSAGTGKTILAAEHARRLGSDSEKILFLVSNSTLQKNIFEEHFRYDQYIEVESFQSLALKFNSKIEEQPDSTKDFTNDLAGNNIKLPYAHIIVDEGQDIKEEWLTALSTVIQGRFFIYYDKSQIEILDHAHTPLWVRDADCKLVLKNNCRNTKQIAMTANSFINNKKLKFKQEVNGPMPIWVECENETEFLAKTISLIKEKIAKENINPKQIKIITVTELNLSYLSKLSKYRHIEISEENGKNRILKTTVDNFKGLEADILFLVDVDFSDLNKESWRQLMYKGTSRAKHELYILSKKLFPLLINDKNLTLKESRKYIADSFHLSIEN